MGISAEHQKKLFQPFSQLDSSTARKYGGSGLGLAISQKLVQRMGGELIVKSDEGIGSCFSFALNFSLVAKPVAPKNENLDDAPLPEGMSVLLVDDDEMNRFFGKKLLAHLGVEAMVVEGGQEAIELLQTQYFDVVFMDVSMPDMDGFEVATQVRHSNRLKQIPIIMITSRTGEKHRERALEIGASSIILVHNHPSGDVNPSKDDVEITKLIIAAAKPLGIAVHDHVIVGGKSHFSFKSKGIISSNSS